MNEFLDRVNDEVNKATPQLEKEIKEVKKNNNFWEIEMCLNEKLSYNIKVKSRNCELFVLKKNVSN